MTTSVLPSARKRAADRSRIRPHTVKVWRCRDCGAVYDAQPYNRQTYSRACPQCGAAESRIYETRVAD